MSTSSLQNLIGNTELHCLENISKEIGAKIFVKLEYKNPGGSVKDRPALNIILNAEKRGELKPGYTLVEGTGGNTGIALALLAREKGYKSIIVMNKTISVEKQQLLRDYGAELILTEPCSFTSPDHYYHVAARIGAKANHFFVNQFENLDNMLAHEFGTAKEIYQHCPEITAFIAASGTGGTIAGVSRGLKSRNEAIECFLMEMPKSVPGPWLLAENPKELPCELFSGVESGLEGIGIDRITGNFSCSRLNGVVQSDALAAIQFAHHLQKHEGLFVGTSAALNILGAVALGRYKSRNGSKKPVIVTIACDGGERYQSKIYNSEWLQREILEKNPDWKVDVTLEEILSQVSIHVLSKPFEGMTGKIWP